MAACACPARRPTIHAISRATCLSGVPTCWVPVARGMNTCSSTCSAPRMACWVKTWVRRVVRNQVRWNGLTTIPRANWTWWLRWISECPRPAFIPISFCPLAPGTKRTISIPRICIPSFTPCHAQSTPPGKAAATGISTRVWQRPTQNYAWATSVRKPTSWRCPFCTIHPLNWVSLLM